MCAARPLIDQITARLQALPDEELAEVLVFVDFLRYKQERERLEALVELEELKKLDLEEWPYTV